MHPAQGGVLFVRRNAKTSGKSATENDGFFPLHFTAGFDTIIFDKIEERTGVALRIGERYTRYRFFSQLGRLQNAHRVRYSLVLSPECTATYEVAVDSARDCTRDSRTVSGLCRQKARWILEYLYENAVPAEHWRDVLDDLLVQI